MRLSSARRALRAWAVVAARRGLQRAALRRGPARRRKEALSAALAQWRESARHQAMLWVLWGRLRAVHRALRAWVAVVRAGRPARETQREAEDGPGVFRVIAAHASAVSAVSDRTGSPPPAAVAAPSSLLDALAGVFPRRPLGRGEAQLLATVPARARGAAATAPLAEAGAAQQPQPVVSVLVLQLQDGQSERVLSALAGGAPEATQANAPPAPAAAPPAPAALTPGSCARGCGAGSCDCGRLRPLGDAALGAAGAERSLLRAERAMGALWSLAHCPHGPGAATVTEIGGAASAAAQPAPCSLCGLRAAAEAAAAAAEAAAAEASEYPRPSSGASAAAAFRRELGVQVPSPAPRGLLLDVTPAATPDATVARAPLSELDGNAAAQRLEHQQQQHASCSPRSVCSDGHSVGAAPSEATYGVLRGTAAARAGMPAPGWDRSGAEKRYGPVVAQLMQAAAGGKLPAGGRGTSMGRPPSAAGGVVLARQQQAQKGEEELLQWAMRRSGAATRMQPQAAAAAPQATRGELLAALLAAC